MAGRALFHAGMSWREKRADNAFGPSPRTVAEYDRARAKRNNYNRRPIPPPGHSYRKSLPFYHGRPYQKRLA